MKKIQVLGPGCPKCEKLAEIARAAAEELHVECSIEKVKDIESIVRMGVMTTPALVVDGVVKSVGKVPTPDQVKAWLA